MLPILLALAIVGPAAYAVNEFVSFRQHPPHGRKQRDAAVLRIRLGAWATIFAMTLTLLWLR